MSCTVPASDKLFFAISASLNKSELDRIVAEAGHLRAPPQRVLFDGGWLTPQAYTLALARHHGVDTVPHPSSAHPADLLIDATHETPTGVSRAISAARRSGRRPVLLAQSGRHTIPPKTELAARTVAQAADALRLSDPTKSAGSRMWLWQYIGGAALVGAMLGFALTAPDLAFTTLLLITVIIFGSVSMFRVMVLAAASLRPASICVSASPALVDSELPTYSVLVPLYREAAVVPGLIEALAALDYPRAKLDVALILEEGDIDTRLAVARVGLPTFMRIIVVPDRQPRTKPKALNVALTLSSGALIAVFDAEDQPAPNQLRQAASAFAAAPGRYACLQARLTIYNPRQSWLTRQFALEYAALFQAFLPALVRLGFPLPLSGTSNHFPRSALRQAAAWDPYNVTEDADLGIRITRAGGRIGLLDSATREEAPATFRQWLPQRTRWIKGWMQTYLVHTREPWRLLKQLGIWRTAGFHAVFAGFLLSLLTYPIFLITIGIELSRPAPFASAAAPLHHAAFLVGAMDLVIGITATLVTALISTRRAGLSDLNGHLLAAPIYWLLISAAGYRALVQIAWYPHLWEKTEHAPRRRLRVPPIAYEVRKSRGKRRSQSRSPRRR